MRFSILPLLLTGLTLTAAQDPRLPQQAQAQIPFAGPEPVPTTLSTPQRLFATGKRLFDAAILGKTPLEDTELRDERDRADGVERLMQENWDKVTAGPKEDVWVILISGPPRDFIDFRFLDIHKNATRLTREHREKTSEMEGFHFARLDYMREVEICTKWLVFRTPIIAFVTDQGRSIRWAPKGLAAAGGDFLYEVLESGRWKTLPVWESRYAPGGDRAYLIDFYLNSSDYVSAKMSQIPNIVWMGLFAAITQSIVKWLHTPNAPQRGVAGVPGTRAVQSGSGDASKKSQ